MGKAKVNKEDLDLYKDDYSESDFWDKVKKYGKSAGKETITKALELYYAAKSKETKPRIKAIIYGALGYFIFPADMLPDILPGVGFIDDLAALTTAISFSLASITPEVKAKAKAKRGEWFDDADDVDESDTED